MQQLYKKRLALAVVALLSSSALASELAPENDNQNETFWQKSKRNINQTWNSSTYDLYIPANTWHNRYTYDKEKTDKYNERPWGIGFGVSRFDADGDWHSLYAVEFQDSHDMIEPIFGYGYQKNWSPDKAKNWRFGLGFTAAVTMRHDYHYIPIPIALPLFSIEYKRFSIQNTYIPGTYNNGNVLFTWVRWQIN